MSETDNLIERGKHALARLNAADKKFNATLRRLGYDAPKGKPVKRRAKRNK